PTSTTSLHDALPISPTITALEQTNESIRYGNSLILKMYRRIEEGIHPELEVGRFLTEDHRLACVAPLAGAIEYRRRRSEPALVRSEEHTSELQSRVE